jgi:surface antigen
MTPDKSDDLLASPVTTPSSTSDAPQYSSRRELRAAAELERRHPAKTPAARQASPRVVSAAASSAAAGKTTAPISPASARTAKPTRAERAAIRKLTAPERPKNRSVDTASITVGKSKKKQNPLVVMFTLLIVPGFIASATIPAFAFAPAGAEHQAEIAQAAETAEAEALPTQDVTVESTVEGPAVSRDVITATTEEELAAQQITAAALASYNSTSRAAGDDYPWPSAGNTLSPLNYYYRQCVDFVAWRLNRDAGSTSAPWKYVWSNLTPNGGNASEWKAAWEAHGWKTSNKPVVGAVAWFTGNHVAYVKAVNGSNVVIEEYNGMVKLGYAMRTIPTSSVPKFLYPPG